jgi:SAM-dependent methyltransferase
MIYGDSVKKCLVYVQAKANEAFWDDLWRDNDLRNYIMNVGKNDHFVSLVTKFFIPQSNQKRVIDAGCGKGQYVYSLQSKNYDAYGIDFAPKIVSAINQAFPELKVRVGDVRNMPFPNAYFDGYWSLGVIEHFYTGYEPILEEMSRVIKPEGFLFVTFPYMSPMRRLKLFLGQYPELKDSKQEPNGFYQFALNHRKVRRDILRYGFKPLFAIPLDGFNGLKNELNSRTVTQFFHLLQKSKNPALRIIRYFLYFIFLPISGHGILLVFKKR